MSTTPSDQIFSGYLPYKATTPAQRAQALAYTQQRLQRQFPSLAAAQWTEFFAQYKPKLWVAGEPQTAVVDEDSLTGFANWIDLSQNLGQNELVPVYGAEAHYLALKMTAYAQLASELVATDPELTTPESINTMRSLFSLLSVGNCVAERVSRMCEVPKHLVNK